MRRLFRIALSMTVAALALSAGAIQAEQRVSTTYMMPVRMEARVGATGCENSPGPQITLDGSLALGSLGVDLIFRNNLKGTHTYEEPTVVDVTLLPAGESLSIPKQPVLGGVGGNPFIWIQVLDGAGNPVTGEILLGRCVQGLGPITADFLIAASAAATVKAEDCANSPGPFITLGGELSLTGINARLIFRNNVEGPHEADETTTVDVVIVPAGESIRFPKQPVLGGVGGNPWISLLFRDGDGDAVGGEFLVGRCEQLSHQ
jgi:hypothetical protein